MAVAGRSTNRLFDVQLSTDPTYFVFHRQWVFEIDVNRGSSIEIDPALSAPGAMPSDLTADGQERMPVTESPPASSNEIHNINLLLGAIIIGAQANVQWLRSGQPDLEAAQRTSARLLAQIQNLCEMVDGLRSGQT